MDEEEQKVKGYRATVNVCFNVNQGYSFEREQEIQECRNYRAASIVFFSHEHGFFLGKEEEPKGWKHFGGKRNHGEADPWVTAQRELDEETTLKGEKKGQIGVKLPVDVYYSSGSKMVLFLKKCTPHMVQQLNFLKITDVKIGYGWVKLEELTDGSIDLPDYILQQLVHVQLPQNRLFTLKGESRQSKKPKKNKKKRKLDDDAAEVVKPDNPCPDAKTRKHARCPLHGIMNCGEGCICPGCALDVAEDVVLWPPRVS